MSSLFAATSGNSPASSLIALAVAVIAIAIMWKVFTKAGEEGWKAIIPFYSSYTLCRIAGRNGWWFLALLVPIVNIVVFIVISIDLARHFGKSAAFGVIGLFLFSIIGYAILAFGEAEYTGVKHA